MLEGPLSHYEILNLLGKGGMGEVYLGKDTCLGRTVAIKVLSPDLAADSTSMKRFVREARAAASLTHPNIVSIYEVGEERGFHFIAMEYLPGTTLRQHIAAKPVPLPEALSIGRQIAEALAAAHAAGIVHRDIKPENVMLSETGHVKILDFGLAVDRSAAAAAGDDATRTQVTAQGQVLGTLAYMAPEQLRGEAADSRSDVFAFGVVLYEMLAGRRPFEASTPLDYVQRVFNSQPDALARFNYEVPESVERVVRKCLEKDRNWRYQSTRELAIDLGSLSRGTTISTAVGAAVPRRPARVRYWTAAGAGVLALGAAVFFAAGSQRAAVDSMAVLPFANLSGDAGLDYAADGLAESIQGDLARVLGARVAAWTTVQRYRGKDIDPPAIGRDLNVRSLLTGRLRRTGSDVQLDVELTDTARGTQGWAQRYRRSPTQLMDMEQVVLSDLATHLSASGAQRMRAAETRSADAQAYDLYLRGRYHLNRRTPADLQQAVRFFREATTKDQRYALAHAGLGAAYAVIANYGIQPPITILPQAKSEARRALELYPVLAEAHTSFGFATAFSDFDWPGAEQSFRRALELNPDDAQAHAWVAVMVLTPLKRYEEALIEIRRAMEVDPAQHVFKHSHVLILYWSRRFDEALAELRKMDRSFLQAAIGAEEAMCLAAQGKPSQAVTALGVTAKAADQTVQLNRSVLAYAFALDGRRCEAEQLARELDEEAKQVYSSACSRAAIAVALKNESRALQLLQECYENRDLDFRFTGVDARFNPLRSNSRFISLLNSAGLH